MVARCVTIHVCCDILGVFHNFILFLISDFFFYYHGLDFLPEIYRWSN